LFTPDSETASDSDSDSDSDMDDLPEMENLAPTVMAGMVKKKGALAFRPRFYSLTSDGMLYSARSDQTTNKKQMVNFEEETTVLSVREKDLIIKGHNAEGPVSIKLRFKDAEERAAWVAAFNKIILQEDEVEQIEDEVPVLFEVPVDDVVRK